LCTDCFAGKDPTEVPGETALGKNVIDTLWPIPPEAGAGVQVDNVSVMRRFCGWCRSDVAACFLNEPHA
jgi:hypothetical protein